MQDLCRASGSSEISCRKPKAERELVNSTQKGQPTRRFEARIPFLWGIGANQFAVVSTVKRCKASQSFLSLVDTQKQ